MKNIAFVGIISRGILFVCILLFINETDDLYLVFVFYNVSSVLALIFAGYIIIKKKLVFFCRPEIKKIICIYKNGFAAFSSQFAPTLYSSSVIFFLGLYSTSENVGIFSAASKVVNIFNSLGFIVANVFFPFLSKAMSFHKVFVKIMLALSVSFTFMSYFGAEYIVSLIFGSENFVVSNIVKYITPMIFFIFIRLIYGQNKMMLLGREKEYQKIILIVCLISFFLSWYLVKKFDIFGAILTVLFASGTMGICTYFVSERVLRDRNEKNSPVR
jgi:PST family polysaccharide transporter